MMITLMMLIVKMISAPELPALERRNWLIHLHYVRREYEVLIPVIVNIIINVLIQHHHQCQHGDGAGVQEDHQAAAGRVSLHVRICQLCAGCSLSKSIQSNPNSNTIGNSTTVLHPSKTALLFCQSNSAGLDPAAGRQNSGEP